MSKKHKFLEKTKLIVDYEFCACYIVKRNVLKHN